MASRVSLIAMLLDFTRYISTRRPNNTRGRRAEISYPYMQDERIEWMKRYQQRGAAPGARKYSPVGERVGDGVAGKRGEERRTKGLAKPRLAVISSREAQMQSVLSGRPPPKGTDDESAAVAT